MQGWVRFALPVGGERTFPSRSQSSGSANPPLWYAQGRVAVPATLPHGVERGKSVRSGPSGSANPPFWYAGGRVAVPVTLPLGGERTSPSRSQSSGSANPPFWYARGRVAVQIRRFGTLGAEWQCRSHCHSVVNVPLLTFTVEWQCDMRHKRNGRCADGFDAGRGLQSSWVRDARAGAREPIVKIGRTQHSDSTCLHRDR